MGKRLIYRLAFIPLALLAVLLLLPCQAMADDTDTIVVEDNPDSREQAIDAELEADAENPPIDVQVEIDTMKQGQVTLYFNGTDGQKVPRKIFFYTQMGQDDATITVRYSAAGKVGVNAVPNPGTVFMGWYDHETGELLSANEIYIFDMTQDIFLEARFEKETGYRIVIDGNTVGGKIAVLPYKTYYKAGETVNILAFPDEGLEVECFLCGPLVYVDGRVKVNVCSSTITVGETDMAVTARFYSGSYSISASAKKQGTGTVTGAGFYKRGDEVTLEATPAQGYTFYRWMGIGKEFSDQNPVTFTAFMDMSLTAEFTNAPFHWIVVISEPEEGGKVIGEGNGFYGYHDVGIRNRVFGPDVLCFAGKYPEGTELRLTAVPDEGYVLDRWAYGNDSIPETPFLPYLAGICEGEDGNDLIIYPKDAYDTEIYDGYIVAYFRKGEYYSVTGCSADEDCGTVTGSGTFIEKSTVVLKAVPAEGYRFVKWMENGKRVPGAEELRVFVDSEHEYTAYFEKITPAYSIANGDITIVGDCVTQNNITVRDSAPVIIGSSDQFSVFIQADTGEDVLVTFHDVAIDLSGKENKTPVRTDGPGTVTILLEGDNLLKAGKYCAGLQKDSNGKLIITADSNEETLTVYGGDVSAGIGGAVLKEGTNIEISGGHIAAYGGAMRYQNPYMDFGGGAGIGGGMTSGGSDITISGGIVEAYGGWGAAGIGGASSADGTGLRICGGTVVAIGGGYASGIGSGPNNGTTGPEIVISGDAQVFAAGGATSRTQAIGAAFGNEFIDLSDVIAPDFTGIVKCYAGGTTADEIKNGIAEEKRTELVTVTFVSGGGVGTMEPQQFTRGVPTSLDSNLFTYDGASFAGWCDKEDGTGASYTDGQQVRFGADITLYAQWHFHVYDRETEAQEYMKSAADCTHAAVYYKSCACGARGTDTFEAGEPAGHKWKAATGTAPKTCEVCGETEGDVIRYLPVGGDTIAWKKGDGALTFTFKRSEQDELCFQNYRETQIDKKVVTVTAKGGSTIITVDEATLETLSVGTHTITVVFADATSEMNLVIREPAQEETTETPGEGEKQPDGTETTETPGEGEKQPDGTEMTETPSEGEKQPDGTETTVTPSEGEKQPDGTETTVTPSEGEKQPDGTETTEIPSEGEKQPDGTETTETPSEGEKQPDGTETTETPSEGEKQPDGTETTVTPSEGEKQPDGTETTVTPSEGEKQPDGTEPTEIGTPEKQAENATPQSPKTGDSLPLVTIIVVVFSGLAGAVSAMARHRKANAN